MQKFSLLLGIFVKPNNRNEEYAGSLRNQYRLFFVDELVPFIDANYKTKANPLERLVIGDSYGGNISALISYNHPDVFALCGLHSAAFQPNNYEAYNLIINGPVEEIKWCSVWGTYESLYTNLRSFRDYLITGGYEMDWLERPEGHSWGLWRASIDRMLEYFYPGYSTALISEKSVEPNDLMLNQNYPNPFNPVTNINFQLITSNFVTLKVFNALGEEVSTLINEEKPAGKYIIEFKGDDLPSGIYFYQLTAGSLVQTKKMILLR